MQWERKALKHPMSAIWGAWCDPPMLTYAPVMLQGTEAVKVPTAAWGGLGCSPPLPTRLGPPWHSPQPDWETPKWGGWPN